MDFIPFIIIIGVVIYFVSRSPRCPHCGSAMQRRSTNNWLSGIDDRWVCDNCGVKPDQH